MIKIVYQTYHNMFRSQAAKDTCVVFTGHLVNAGLGFVSIVVLSRYLGPGNFGLFAVCIAVMGVITELSDLGGNVGLIRFASLHIANSEDEMARRIYSIFFKIKTLIGSLLFIAGLFLARPLAELIFHKPQLTLPLRVAFFGIAGLLFLGFINSVFISNRFFGRSTILNYLHGAGKVLCIFGLFLCHKLNLINGLSVYVMLPFVLFFIGLAMLPSGMVRPFQFKFDIALFRRVFNFSKWIFLWTITSMLYLRLDVFMLAALAESEQVGFYYAAHKLAYFFPLVAGALVTTLLPRVSALKENRELKNYIHKILVLAPFLLFFTIIALILANWMVPFLFGYQYIQAILPFQILAFGFSVTTVVFSASMVFYAMNKPYILFFVTLLQLVVNFGIDLLLIPRYKVFGACAGFFCARFIGALLVFYLVRKYVFGRKKLVFT